MWRYLWQTVRPSISLIEKLYWKILNSIPANYITLHYTTLQNTILNTSPCGLLAKQKQKQRKEGK